MQLILMRHGEAHPPVTTDEVRQLTLTGQQQAALTAQQIMQTIQPDLFIVSPLIRAQQTRAAFEQFCPDVPILIFDGIKPEDDARTAIHWLSQQQGQCIVVVCHMNIVAYMGGLLTGEAAESFALAEARLYTQEAIGIGFSQQKQRWLPSGI